MSRFVQQSYSKIFTNSHCFEAREQTLDRVTARTFLAAGLQVLSAVVDGYDYLDDLPVRKAGFSLKSLYCSDTVFAQPDAGSEGERSLLCGGS